MAFRDDRVALRKRLESLETELGEVRLELEQTREELKKERKLRRQGWSPFDFLKPLFAEKPKPRKTRVLFVVIGIAVVVIGIVAIVILEVTEADRSASQNPGPLPPLPGCTRWTGTATGNSTNELYFRLCIRGDRVEGMSQWISQRAGWSRRSLTGTWEASTKRMTVKEKAFAAQQARTGWKFCLVENMQLERVSPKQISGTFRSQQCNDQGKIELRRVGEEPAAAGPDSSAAAAGTTGTVSSRTEPDAAESAPPSSVPGPEDGSARPTHPDAPLPAQDRPARDHGF